MEPNKTLKQLQLHHVVTIYTQAHTDTQVKICQEGDFLILSV